MNKQRQGLHLSTADHQKVGFHPWLNIRSARWLRFESAPTLQRIAWLYRIEADARPLSADERLAMRRGRSKPLCDEMHLWLQLERKKVPDGSAIAGAIDYSLNHWRAFMRFLEDGNVPIDNNHLENQMRPWAMACS